MVMPDGGKLDAEHRPLPHWGKVILRRHNTSQQADRQPDVGRGLGQRPAVLNRSETPEFWGKRVPRTHGRP
jgi:hypothetical protein